MVGNQKTMKGMSTGKFIDSDAIEETHALAQYCNSCIHMVGTATSNQVSKVLVEKSDNNDL